MKSALTFLMVSLLYVSPAWGGLTVMGKYINCDMAAEDAEYGLVVLTASIPDSEAVAGAPMRIDYVYNTVGGTFLSDRNISTSRFGFFKGVKSDFEGFFSRLHVIKVKAGDYAFKTWGYGDAQNAEWKASSAMAKIPFRVTAGRAIYLGSFEPDIFYGENILGMNTARIWPKVVDRSQRDLALLFQKCPSVDIMQVDVSPVDLSPWQEKSP